jgi:hypothetical protein
MWIKTAVLIAVMAASVATPLALRHRAQAEWREKDALWRQQAGQLEAASAENRRLSDLVAQVKSSSSASNGQLGELLRLRGELGQLRQTVSEMDRLRAMNQQLLAAASGSPAQSGAPSPPEGQTIQAYWPKAQLASAGYADAASALKTALWAMSRGDPDALAMSVTPEAKAALERQDWQDHKKPAEELADRGKWIADSLSPASGFYVVGQKLTAQDRAILDVHFEGEGKTRKFELKQVGGEWKLNAMGLGGGVNDDMDTAAWP